jgi:phosphonate transport system ATP-binding protein
VAAGEQVAVIGPSGAGKTTLLQVLACACRPPPAVCSWTAGPLGAAAARPAALRGRLFLAPQVPPLPPRQRVVTAVLAGRLPALGLLASLRSLFYPTDIPAAHAALAKFDLADKLFDRVDRLCGRRAPARGPGPRPAGAGHAVAGGRAAVGAGPHALAPGHR